MALYTLEIGNAADYMHLCKNHGYRQYSEMQETLNVYTTKTSQI